LTHYLETRNVSNENIMLLYLQACNALLVVDESRDSEIVDTLRDCSAEYFESTTVRTALLKVISLSAYEQLSLGKIRSGDSADAQLSFPEESIDSSKTV
jgi:hypothetical protein